MSLTHFDRGYRDTLAADVTDAQMLMALEQVTEYVVLLAARLAYCRGREAALRDRLRRRLPTPTGETA